MPKILLPSRDEGAPKECPGRKEPVARGTYYELDLSQEEHKFWKSISNEEREKLRQEAFKRCFYDALKEQMQSHPRKAGIFGT